MSRRRSKSKRQDPKPEVLFDDPERIDDADLGGGWSADADDRLLDDDNEYYDDLDMDFPFGESRRRRGYRDMDDWN